MKTLTKLALTLVLLATTAAARAEWVSGHFRSSGTHVAPYYRTPANGIPYDNLSYRGYPSQQPGYVSPRTYESESSYVRPSYEHARPTPLPSYDCLNNGPQILPGVDRNYRIRPLGY